MCVTCVVCVVCVVCEVCVVCVCGMRGMCVRDMRLCMFTCMCVYMHLYHTPTLHTHIAHPHTHTHHTRRKHTQHTKHTKTTRHNRRWGSTFGCGLSPADASRAGRGVGWNFVDLGV